MANLPGGGLISGLMESFEGMRQKPQLDKTKAALEQLKTDIETTGRDPEINKALRFVKEAFKVDCIELGITDVKEQNRMWSNVELEIKKVILQETEEYKDLEKFVYDKTTTLAGLKKLVEAKDPKKSAKSWLARVIPGWGALSGLVVAYLKDWAKDEDKKNNGEGTFMGTMLKKLSTFLSGEEEKKPDKKPDKKQETAAKTDESKQEKMPEGLDEQSQMLWNKFHAKGWRLETRKDENKKDRIETGLKFLSDNGMLITKPNSKEIDETKLDNALSYAAVTNINKIKAAVKEKFPDTAFMVYLEDLFLGGSKRNTEDITKMIDIIKGEDNDFEIKTQTAEGYREFLLKSYEHETLATAIDADYKKTQASA